MDAILVIASPEKGRELILPLSLGGVNVRQVLHSGHQLIEEVRQEPAQAVLLTEMLPDGPAAEWLAALAALPGRPLVVVLLYGIEGAEAVRQRCREAYGPSVEVVPAGALPAHQVASEAAAQLERLRQLFSQQDQEAAERLQQVVPPAETPGPVRFGSLALVGASGGVGTSTLVANLAALAAMAGSRVLVIDADFSSGGAQGFLLGAPVDEGVRGLHHLRWSFLSGREGTPAEVSTWTDQVKLPQASHERIQLLQLPSILDSLWNLPAEQILWGYRALEPEVDLILFDLGTGLGSARTLKLMEAVGRTLLVVGGWSSSIHGAGRLLAALEGRPELNQLFVLLREGESSSWGTRAVSGALGQPIYGKLPTEPILAAGARQEGSSPLPVIQAPDAPYSAAVRRLAAAMGLVQVTQIPAAKEPKERRGLFGLALGRRS